MKDLLVTIKTDILVPMDVIQKGKAEIAKFLTEKLYEQPCYFGTFDEKNVKVNCSEKFDN
jgi:hypothetical protein